MTLHSLNHSPTICMRLPIAHINPSKSMTKRNHHTHASDTSLTGIARKKAESDALFLSIGEGTILIDENGRISRINQPALTILGYSEDELLGKWFPAAIPSINEDGEIIPTIERPIAQVFLTGKPLSTRTYYRRKDGSKVIVYLTVSPVILEGKPIG